MGFRKLECSCGQGRLGKASHGRILVSQNIVKLELSLTHDQPLIGKGLFLVKRLVETEDGVVVPLVSIQGAMPILPLNEPTSPPPRRPHTHPGISGMSISW